MKLHGLLAVLYVTLTVGIATAAVTQANIAGARAAGSLKETWISGASAPTYSIYKGWSKGCDAGSEAIFTANASVGKPGSTGNFNAYACTRNGVVSVVYHSVEGGSISAYSPHMITGSSDSGVPLATAKLKRIKNLGTAVCPVTGTWNGVAAFAGCQTLIAASAPDGAPTLPAGGFSELEASMFGLDIYNNGAGSEVATPLVQVYGVAVSKNLYRALQVAQGIYTTPAAAETADAEYSPLKSPSIFAAEYTSMIAFGSGYQVDWSPLLGSVGVGKSIYLHRQLPGAGTQAMSNAYFLNNPCGVANALYAAGKNDSIDNSFIVSEEISDEQVRLKLTAAAAAGNYAIGVLPATYNWRSESSTHNGYRFLKLDGAHPEGNADIAMARNTAVKGHNKFTSQMQAFIANTAAGGYGELVINQIIAAMGKPASCGDVQRGFYLEPIFYVESNDSACTIGSEIGKGTRLGNTCQALQLFY